MFSQVFTKRFDPYRKMFALELRCEMYQVWETTQRFVYIEYAQSNIASDLS